MIGHKALRNSFLAKMTAGILFIISSFMSVFGLICIIFLTSYGGFDSSKDAAITSMRDSFYFQVIQYYRSDAVSLCVIGDKDVSIFDDTNYRFVVKDEYGVAQWSNLKSSDGPYIYKNTYKFWYPVEMVAYDEENEEYSSIISTCEYSITSYVDGNLQQIDQFLFLNNFILILYNLRFVTILLLILSVALAIFTFVFLMSSAGYRNNSETPNLSWFDRIYLEFILITALIIWICELSFLETFDVFSISLAIWCILMLLFDTAMGLLICMSLSTRLRCRRFWKTTLIYTILRKAGRLIKKVLSNIPALWKLILFVILLQGTELFFLLLWGIDDLYVIFFLEKLLLIPVTFYFAAINHKLEKTGRLLASGDMSATIDTRFFSGTQKQLGEHLNSIKLGISRAVDDKMKSERFKTELITNVSHDIKTPLTSIINYVDLLNKEELSNESAKEYIQIISRNSDRLKKLVVDLVDASKASSGVLNLNMQPIKIDVLLEQLVGEYSERLSENHLEPIIHCPDESLWIMADGQRIYRVFDNLMNNICKYALTGTRVYLLLEKDNNQTIITFKNISSEKLDISAKDLLKRFVRGDKSRNTEGSGLGLSIAESLTKLQNGTFDISLDGDLFKIIITFPLIEAPQN